MRVWLGYQIGRLCRPILMLTVAWPGLVQALADDCNTGAKAPITPVIQFHRDVPIDPARSDFVARSFEHAAQIRSLRMGLSLDTPGDLDTAMRGFIKRIMAPIPVATYVVPGGARAASTGTYLLCASHIATMAPATNPGDETPARIALPGETGDATPPTKDKAEAQEPPNHGIAAFTITSMMLCVVLTRLLCARRKRVVFGREQLSGSLGAALEDSLVEDRIWIQSETWTAKSDRPVSKARQPEMTECGQAIRWPSALSDSSICSLRNHRRFEEML